MVDYGSKYDVVADLYDQYVNLDFDIPFWVDECSQAGEVLDLQREPAELLCLSQGQA